MTQSSTPALPPLEIDAAEGPFPLGMPPERFLRDYWQKRPVLIRRVNLEFWRYPFMKWYNYMTKQEKEIFKK